MMMNGCDKVELNILPSSWVKVEFIEGESTRCSLWFLYGFFSNKTFLTMKFYLILINFARKFF